MMLLSKRLTSAPPLAIHLETTIQGRGPQALMNVGIFRMLPRCEGYEGCEACEGYEGYGATLGYEGYGGYEGCEGYGGCGSIEVMRAMRAREAMRATRETRVRGIWGP